MQRALLAGATILCWSAAAPPAGKLMIVSPTEELVYSQRQDGCNGGGPQSHDYPDWSARAFRAADGTITLMDSCSLGYFRSLRAPGSTSFVRDCRPVLQSGFAGPTGRPEQYNNSIWLQSFWAFPDVNNSSTGTVVALVHNEFHGERATADPTLCPSQTLDECWYANILTASSTDGGATFVMPVDVSERAAVVSPYRYIPDGGRQGLSEFTNIVQSNGSYYFLALNSHNGTGVPGTCLWRTADVTNSSSWRAWDGVDFTIASHDPYLTWPQGRDCVPTGPAELRFNLVWSDVIGCWLSVGLGNGPTGSPAFLYATSSDLIHWSELELLRYIDAGPSFPQQKYAGILDLELPGVDANYMRVGASPHLYYTRLNADDDRDIVRQQLQISLAPASDPRF